MKYCQNACSIRKACSNTEPEQLIQQLWYLFQWTQHITKRGGNLLRSSQLPSRFCQMSQFIVKFEQIDQKIKKYWLKIKFTIMKVDGCHQCLCKINYVSHQVALFFNFCFRNTLWPVHIRYFHGVPIKILIVSPVKDLGATLHCHFTLIQCNKVSGIQVHTGQAKLHTPLCRRRICSQFFFC